jgi:hypothetical protein
VSSDARGSHPLRGGAMPAHAGDSAVSGRLTALDDEVAHQLRIRGQRPHRQDRGRGVSDALRRQRRRGHGQHTAARLQPNAFRGEARGAAGERERVRGRGRVGEEQARRHRPKLPSRSTGGGRPGEEPP